MFVDVTVDYYTTAAVKAIGAVLLNSDLYSFIVIIGPSTNSRICLCIFG